MTDAVAAWREFCGRMADIGSDALADAMVVDDRERDSVPGYLFDWLLSVYRLYSAARLVDVFHSHVASNAPTD